MADKKKISERGQIEIIGLLIIVILVTIIILLVITFGIRQPTGPKTTQQVKDEQIATLFFPTILETTTTCDRTMRELLSDCAYTNEITCAGEDSCTFANKTLIEVLNKTLSSYGYSYAVKVWKPDPEIVFTLIDEKDCNGAGARNSITKTNPFPTNVNYAPVFWSIRICK